MLNDTYRMDCQVRCIKKGAGAVFEGQEIGGRWTASEASRHINILELEVAFLALESFGDKIAGAHIQLHLDNTTAVAYINNMGGSKSLELNCIATKNIGLLYTAG